ncbi:NADP oxidoreductase coenzyme F420-dependent [Penicillium cf. viridicatum]|uniref:NADP oxidoreductase coenzyme F420-dependent n=1 Tax=Penicillium cf. viridicatum TaxID=2972119 RepID=A0A9W9SWQ1_9EURO|nr:NADP oxidoreductase coenzyme F420-dependent [Penicillium cf. viridicatum]
MPAALLSRSMRDGTVVGQTAKGKTQLLPPFTLGKNTHVGVPWNLAHIMIFQSMQGTATMLQGETRESPGGCTIGSLMGMEEAGVYDHVGGARREAVTLARLMETTPHVNDTRH